VGFKLILLSMSEDDSKQLTGDEMTEMLASLCISSPESFVKEETDAMLATKKLLLSNGKCDPKSIHPILLAVTVLNCKLEVEKSAEKYEKWFALLKDWDVTEWADLFTSSKDAKQEVSADTIPKIPADVGQQFASYATAGKDKKGRSIFWIAGKQIPPEEEKESVRAGALYFTAIHADLFTMRSGVCFVIDTSNSSTTQSKNAKAMQKLNQAYPLRPQRIFIVGAGYLKRLAINALIKFASLFSKEKVLQRIVFADVDVVRKEIDPEQMPVYLGGKGGGIQNTAEWVSQRLKHFPTLPKELYE